MPTATLRTPTIGEIYAAFDVDAHQLFRQAMALSRGGVVRVADLLAALCATEQIPRDQIPASWVTQIHRRPDEAWITPMSNEPALRELLVTAHRLAVSRSSDQRPVITPLGLLASALLQTERAGTLDESRRARSRAPHPSLVAPPPQQPISVEARNAIIDRAFQDWVTAQESNHKFGPVTSPGPRL